jgi:hypothetical protein
MLFVNRLHRGKPSKPIRLMVGLSILKHLEDLFEKRDLMALLRGDPPCDTQLNFNHMALL